MEAVAFDVPIPGYDTPTTNNLRLWSSKASGGEFDFQKFNNGDYESSVAEQQRAETISAVLYPNDNLDRGKELRLKQQYFWVAASLYDIVRRFKKSKREWRELPDQVAIQLNDTHPTLAIVELQRILIDIEGLSWDNAWEIVTNTFGYTNHTVLPEALEKWPVGMIQKLLPRHLQIIYDINLFFLQKVEKLFPNDRDMLRRVSIIEESQPKMVRMAYLAIVGSHKVNGVAELHSDLIKTTIFKDFVAIYGPDKFTNVTNGITPRRWLHQANPRLSELIASKCGGDGFLKDLTKLSRLEPWAKDKEFRREWAEIKYANKVRLAKHIKETMGITVSPSALFDVQVKRIHEYKRQQLNIFGVIHRYMMLKAMKPEERKKVMPRVSIFGGKAAPGYWMAKQIIHLINAVGSVVNQDEEIGDLLKVIFLEDYNVSKAEMICPASDISEHISTAGTEASGTSNMKFVLNGGLIIGTCDGANVGGRPAGGLEAEGRSEGCLGAGKADADHRLRLHARLARATFSYLVRWPKTWRICGMHTRTGRTRWMASWTRSSRRLRRARLDLRRTFGLWWRRCATTVTTTWCRRTFRATWRRIVWWMRRTGSRMTGWPSASRQCRAWASSAAIGASTSTRKRFGTLSRSSRRTRTSLLVRA